MQSCKSTFSRIIPRSLSRRQSRNLNTLNSIVRPLSTSSNMALFHRGLYAPETSFAPLFRLLDDFDSYSRQVEGGQNNGHGHRHRRSARLFSPKFDVRETEAAYELHGELPGIDREQVNIEFTDPQTVVVSGRVERSYSAGSPPAGLVEDTQPVRGQVTEAGEQEASKNSASHKATVSEEDDEAAKEKGVPTPAESPAAEPAAEPATAPAAPADKFWVSERSVGEFSRSFNFPSRVDQDGVTANLKDGVLTVVVPKAKKHETRRVAIN